MARKRHTAEQIFRIAMRRGALARGPIGRRPRRPERRRCVSRAPNRMRCLIREPRIRLELGRGSTLKCGSLPHQ